MTLQEARTVTSTHLPAPPTLLIGCAAEVNQLCNRLLRHSGRLLTLVGPPGIGKTRLGLAVAAQLQPHYPYGVRIVPLAAISDVVIGGPMRARADAALATVHAVREPAILLKRSPWGSTYHLGRRSPPYKRRS